MRIVLDTNVLLSAIFFGGTPGRVLDAWRNHELTLVLSPDIFEEYRRVGEELARRHGELELFPLLTLVARHAELVEPRALDERVCRDPEDDKFFACALAGDAHVIVSGDDDLRSIGTWKGIRVRTPRQFVDEELA